MLSDTYFCNFSLFQSMPDSWAVKQLFPIMPIHRLKEQPTRQAVLGDISCDSDGKIDQFIDRRDVKRTLPLHPFNGEPYYLAAFLVGAYQEILGDLHNLFGDTNAVHVSLNEQGEVVLETVIKGDTVREVLDYVQFNVRTLIEQFRHDVEQAVREGRIGYEESAGCCSFTRMVCTATPTWKTRTRSSGDALSIRSGCRPGSDSDPAISARPLPRRCQPASRTQPPPLRRAPDGRLQAKPGAGCTGSLAFAS